MEISTEYDIGDMVYLVTDEMQKKRMVTHIEVNGKGSVLYGLSCGEIDTKHYGFEMTPDINVEHL